MMITEGLWIPGKRRTKYRNMRDRRLMIGALIQLDGSPHDWFEGRADKCTLLVFIDDATSRIMWLEFVKSEFFEGVASATQKYIQAHGRPVALYVDYGSVFSINKSNLDRNKFTQFERIMADLGVHINHAGSPQAKGRVERCNGTMQDRLVKEMRLVGISSMEAANQFVQNGDFIAKHNAKYAVPPAQEADAHRSAADYNLYQVFCSQEERVITNDFTITYKNKIIQLEKQQLISIRPRNRVVVYEHLDQKITLSFKNNPLQFKEIGMKKLKPTDYVLLENERGREQNRQAFPVYGSLKKAANNHGFEIGNRNFSPC